MKSHTVNIPQLEKTLDELIAKYDARSDTGQVMFALALPRRNWSWKYSSPGSTDHYFIASATKLYVTALIMQLRHEGRLDLDAPATRYLDPSIMDGIHLLRGVDSSRTITVLQLLAHTSGIADYFEQPRSDGSSQYRKCMSHDFGWSFDDVLHITREQLTPGFAPGSPGKAFYSDTNYQLLGAIIESLEEMSYEQVLLRRIIEPLDLAQTYPFTNEIIKRYRDVAPMYFGKRAISIPRAMASVRADGGIVSTASDGIIFLQAFMTGKLFPASFLQEMQRTWNPIFPPLEYGVGLMRFLLPRYYTLFMEVPPMIGHSGASGALLFYVPTCDLYISGTVNQIKKRSLSYNLMVRLVMACMGEIKRVSPF
ncbi:MAG: serine hydrolase domain-containing protein [Chlorobium sp.]